MDLFERTMFEFETSNIVFGILFSLIGFCAFCYWRKMEYWQPLAIGLAMMVYPYFTPNWVWTLGVGLFLSAVLWRHHDE